MLSNPCNRFLRLFSLSLILCLISISINLCDSDCVCIYVYVCLLYVYVTSVWLFSNCLVCVVYMLKTKRKPNGCVSKIHSLITHKAHEFWATNILRP